MVNVTRFHDYFTAHVQEDSPMVADDGLTTNHPVVSHDEWLAARRALLEKEKAFTRQCDGMSRLCQSPDCLKHVEMVSRSADGSNQPQIDRCGPLVCATSLAHNHSLNPLQAPQTSRTSSSVRPNRGPPRRSIRGTAPRCRDCLCSTRKISTSSPSTRQAMT